MKLERKLWWLKIENRGYTLLLWKQISIFETVLLKTHLRIKIENNNFVSKWKFKIEKHG